MNGVARWAGVTVLIVVAGLIGLIPLFSDSATIWINVAEIVLIFFGAGLLVGWLHPRRWWIAGFAAWPGFLLLAAGFVSKWQFRDAPVLTVSVGDGFIRTDPDRIDAQRIRLRQRNEGSQVHELQIFRVEDPGVIERLRNGDLDPEARGVAFRPLGAGEEDIAYLARGSLVPGAYAIGCLRETEAGSPHISLGELAPFRVEDEP